MDAKTGIVRKKEASSASLQPHVPRPSREEEGANQTGIPPSPPLSPLFTRRTVPLRSAPHPVGPSRPSRGAGRQGREAGRMQHARSSPFPFNRGLPARLSALTPPTLSRSPPLAARLRVRTASPRTAVPPRRWGDGRQTAARPALPPAQPPPGTPPPRYVSRAASLRSSAPPPHALTALRAAAPVPPRRPGDG